MSNKIIKRSYLVVEWNQKTPLCVSSGDNKYADNDVMRDFDGHPFIPGSSIAGALRNYLNDDKKVFGYSEGEKGNMSPVYVSDFYYDEPDKKQFKVRDQIRVDKYKIAEDGAKFDMEVVEPENDENAVSGKLYFEIEQFQENAIDVLETLKKGIAGIHKGDIRFGLKKNRGYGEFRVLNVYEKTFDMNNEEQKKAWLSFDVREYYKTGENITKSCLAMTDEKYESFITLTIPLKLKGGISIRDYHAKKNEPDFAHITSAGHAVIPGTSWNGAIRHQCEAILEELQAAGNIRASMIDEMFGKVVVEKGQDKTAKQSSVVIGESRLKGLTDEKPVFLTMTRNKIDRFDASTEKGALYTEKAVFSGQTELVIKVRKQEQWKWQVGMLLLVIQDIQQGYLPIGGQTAIGRGIFETNGEISISQEIDQEMCIKEIVKRMKKEA